MENINKEMPFNNYQAMDPDDFNGIENIDSNIGEKTKPLCGICGKTFSKTRNLKNHISTVHEGMKNHKCETCGKAFCSKQYLYLHIGSVHEGIKNHKCDFNRIENIDCNIGEKMKPSKTDQGD